MNCKSLLVLFMLVGSNHVSAEFDWAAITLDNDIIVNSDSGYTNGIYFSLFDVRYNESDKKVGFLTRPMSFLINKSIHAVNAYSFGNNQADRVSTTIGVVGPASLAEPSQKAIHSLIGSDEPLGWDTQIDNELVFQFTRARLWRKPLAKRHDILYTVDASLGTLQSGVSGSIIYRFGSKLHTGYTTPLLNLNRLANPVAIDGGWYSYFGLESRYAFNQIIADGNTFKDSRSVDYRKSTLGVTLGFAYSWSDYSLSVALRDTAVGTRRFNNAEDDFTRYGTITFGKKLH